MTHRTRSWLGVAVVAPTCFVAGLAVVAGLVSIGQPRVVGALALAAVSAFAPLAGLMLMGEPRVAVGLVVGVVALAAYFAPTIISGARRHHNVGPVAVVNAFLGWTFVGWVVALAMAASATRANPQPAGA